MHSDVRYRLIALDMDGTTLDPYSNVTDRTRRAIHALVERGVYVCFATGRNFTEARRVLEQANHFPLSVFVGGASVVDTAAGKPLMRQPMSPDLARELCHDFEFLGHAVLALQDTFATGVDYLCSSTLSMDAETAKWMQVTEAVVKFCPDLPTYAHTDTLRVGVVAPLAEGERIGKLFADKYGPRVTLHSIAVHQAGVSVLEVFDPAVTKWLGVSFVAEKLGIPRESVVAIGDDLNDLGMLTQAGLGVAMGNAHPVAKAAAALTIGRNSEDGLAVFLEKLISEERIAAA